MDSTNACRSYWPTAQAPADIAAVLDLDRIRSEYQCVIEQAGKHHTDPMSAFVAKDLVMFVEAACKKGIRIALHNNEAHVYRWQRTRICNPLLSPHECRERNLCYAASVIVDMWREVHVNDKLVEKKCILPDFHLFSFPLMMMGTSGGWMREYGYDSGGYYISQSGSTGVASERIMPLNLYRRHNHPFMFPTKASASGDKKTASKSFAAASSQYQKYQRQGRCKDVDEDGGDEDEEEEEEGKRRKQQQKQQQQQPDICMELRCLHESRNLFHSTTTMSLVLTGFYVKNTDKKSHLLYLQLPKFKPKTQPGGGAAAKQKKKNVRIPLLTVLLALGYTTGQTLEYLESLNNAWRQVPLRSVSDCDRIMHFILERHRLSGLNSHTKALFIIGRSTKDGAGVAEKEAKEGEEDEEEKSNAKLAHAMLCQQMLPFIGLDQASYPAKARYLIYLWYLAMMRMSGIDSTTDDQDHEVNQRYETNAAAWASLIRQSLTIYVTNAENSLRGYYNTDPDKRGAIDWNKVLKEKSTSKRLAWCLSTGIWSPKQITKETRRNMSMSLGRTNDCTYSSYLRRGATTVKAQDKSIKPRMLHMSQYARADAGDTSEGEKSGSVRMVTDGFSVSVGSSSAILWQVLEKQPDTTIHADIIGGALVLLNGVPKGWTTKPAAFCECVRTLRRSRRIHHEVSVCWQRDAHQSVIYLLTEPGRSLRPLVSLHAPFPVELIDASEERSLYIAFSPSATNKQHTHCELDPALAFGRTMNTPFAETDQSPRITFQMNMNKQALGGPGIHNPLRCQAGAQIGLFYAHKPLVFQQSSHGLNLLEAMSTDVTDEDNMVFSANLLESGGFLGYQTRTYQAKETGPVNSQVSFPHISSTTGLPEIGCMLTEGQAIMTRKDESIDVRTNDEGQVTRTTMCRADKSARAWLTFMLKVWKGDKFSSRHGQKVTKSIARRAADMLYNPQSGEIVDLVTTLVCLAGRMTAGQLHEMQASLQGVRDARFLSGKAYEASETFFRRNMESSGPDYRFYKNGRTGRLLPNRIYVGLIFQMRLKHLVYYKEHARGIGPVVTSTRQPTETRSHDSGLRLGEMERDCLVGHGASHNALERYFKGSDAFYVTICERCGIFTNKTDVCQLCHQQHTVKRTQMSAATKTFWNEVQGFGIIARFEVSHSPHFIRKQSDLFAPIPPPPSTAALEMDDSLVERLVNLCIEQQQQQQQQEQADSSKTKIARKRKKRVS